MRGTQAPVAYNFFPNAAPGQEILEAPHNLIYLPVPVDVISTLSVWSTDQHGELLDLRGEELTIRFHLRATSIMYIQYKVNVSENQMDTLKDAIRIKKGVTPFQKVLLEVIMSCYLHQHISIDWTSGWEACTNSFEC